MRVSDGQKRLYSLKKVKDEIKEKLAKTNNKEAIMTFMLDEPDRGLNFEAQVLFWKNFITNFSMTGQVIIATHSIVPLFLFNRNIIEIVPGSVKKAKELYKELGSYDEPEIKEEK